MTENEFPGTYAYPRGTTLRIRKGIVGVRKYLTENATGWHVYIIDGDPNNAYQGFEESSLSDLRKVYGAYIMIGVQGNTVTFEPKYGE